MKTNNNYINKTLIKHLANAPLYALERTLGDLHPDDHETVLRIWRAIINNPSQGGFKNGKNEN